MICIGLTDDIDIPATSTNQDLQQFLAPYIQYLQISEWKCAKVRNKGCGLLRIERYDQAQSFINRYHREIRWPRLRSWVYLEKSKVQDDGKKLNLELQQSKLESEIWDWYEPAKSLSQMTNPPPKRVAPFADQTPYIDPYIATSVFTFSFIQCGHFEYNDSQPEFRPVVPLGCGRIVFGKSSSAILIDGPSNDGNWKYRIDINHWMINIVVASESTNSNRPSLIISMQNAPKMFQRGVPAPVNPLLQILNPYEFRQQQYLQSRRKRISHCHPRHKDVAGLCFVYRLVLNSNKELEKMYQHLKNLSDTIPSMKFQHRLSMSRRDMVTEITVLNGDIGNSIQRGNIDFKTAFQTLKLAYNGKLLPWDARALLPTIEGEYKKFGNERLVLGLREFYRSLSSAGPETSPSEFEQSALVQLLKDCIKGTRVRGSMFDTVRKHKHLMLIHRFRITPTAIYLEGPEPEPSNRVLRRYEHNVDCFTRVCFGEEDGDRLEAGLNTVLSDIYDHFQQHLNNGIQIFGRKYKFLGFSSSSLRSHTCWFMAPFIIQNRLIAAANVIEDLGDFSHFRIPAKCAARIGQAFTETNSATEVHPSIIAEYRDVERDGRCFSDGCGTISPALLDEVCSQYPKLLMQVKPRLLQIRFQGMANSCFIREDH
jgi:RNA dependent RNA polymerase